MSEMKRVDNWGMRPKVFVNVGKYQARQWLGIIGCYHILNNDYNYRKMRIKIIGG